MASQSRTTLDALKGKLEHLRSNLNEAMNVQVVVGVKQLVESDGEFLNLEYSYGCRELCLLSVCS